MSGLARRVVADTTPLKVSPPFRRLWLGTGISNIGSQLTNVVVAIQVYDLSGSNLAVGFVGGVALVPLIVFGLYGGAIADAFDRRLAHALDIHRLGDLHRRPAGAGGGRGQVADCCCTSSSPCSQPCSP